MITDGPWKDEEKTLFQRVIGFPGDQTYWAPGGFVNVPLSADRASRSAWLSAMIAIIKSICFSIRHGLLLAV